MAGSGHGEIGEFRDSRHAHGIDLLAEQTPPHPPGDQHTIDYPLT